MNASKSDFFFLWKKCIFCTYLKSTELFLEWLDVNDLNNQHEKGFSQSKDSPEGFLFDAFENNFSRNDFKNFNEITRTVLDINHINGDSVNNDIIKIGYSFDNGCLSEVPVILLRSNSKRNNMDPNQAVITQQIYLVGVRELVEHNIFSQQRQSLHKLKNMDTGASLEDQKSYKYELVKLRVFHFKDQLCNINKKNLHVITNFQILYIDESLRTLKIFYLDIHSKNIAFQDFKVDHAENKDTRFSILDIYIEHESGLSYVFVSVKNAEIITILCFQISYANSYEPLTKAEAYEIKPISLSKFISPDLTQIIKHMQIISTSTYVDYSTKSENICSSICLLTKTGFALKVVNSMIKSVINVKSSFEGEEFTGENWGSSCIKFVSLTDCDDKNDIVALQIDNLCCLINWSKEKVVETWTSVYLISRYSDLHYCPPSLLIVLLPKDSRDNDHSLLLHLCESDVLFVSIDEMKMKEEEMNEENQTLSFKQPGEEIQHIERPMRALLFQKKISELAVKESESVMQNKISFLINSWKQLLQSSSDSGQAALVPLFNGSTYARENKKSLSKKPHVDHPYLSPFGLWKKTFDHFLIVGLSLKNNSMRPVSHICLKLIISSVDRMQSTETKLHIWEEAGGTSSCHNKSGTKLFPGQTCEISSYADISKCFSGVSVKLLSFICYQDVKDDFTISSLPKYSEQFYSEISITAEEILNGIYSVDKYVLCMKDSENKISLADVKALDVIQTCHKLSVQSIVSSVGCLSHKLDQDPFCMYLDITKQYLITDTSQLKMCRVQILHQSSRTELNIKIYVRSEYEALLLVQFLNSLLPEDVTIIPDNSTNSYLQDLGGQVLEKSDHLISCIKNTLTDLVECPNGSSDSHLNSKHCSDGKDRAVESLLQDDKIAGQEMEVDDIQKHKKIKKK